MKKETENPVIVKLMHDPGAGQTEQLRAYAVDGEGRIIEHAAFEGTEARLISGKERLGGNSRIYIARDLTGKIHPSKITERTLLKANAYETVKNFTDNVLAVRRIPSTVFIPFPFFNCLITGHVNKNFFIDGQLKKFPLCNIRVHICEVETELRWPFIPVYYRPIPDWIINEIGQKFVDIQAVPVVTSPVLSSGTVNTTGSMKMRLPVSSLTKKNTIDQSKAKITPPAPLPHHVLSAMTSGSADIIRRTMIDYHDLLYPYFCLWPIYWPYLYTYDEETIVTTDCNGHFEMWENTFSEDGPLNIYIWAEACIDGHWVTVYKPSVPCHTFWNYKCGTNINVTVADSRVQPCHCDAEGPADAVWFRSIGWNASALTIEQSDASAVSVQGINMNNVGCTNILGEPIRPFAGNLTFLLFCGADIFNAGVTHYRWKKTMIADAGLHPIPVAYQAASILPGNVTRDYLVKLSATHYETHSVSLGAVGNSPDIAYRIPHQNIAAETLIPAEDLPLNPAWTDIFFNSANIDSHSLTDGLYRFDLELLKQDMAGNFHVVSVAKAAYQVSEASNIGATQDAPAEYLITDGSANALSLSFKVRIDNAPCTAHINEVTLKVNDITETSGPCGFLRYTDVNEYPHISFVASQPRNFAKFNFNIIKGNNTIDTAIHPAGYVISDVGDFKLSAGQYSDDAVSAGQLIGQCPQAAFSENLSVYSLATDGTNDLRYTPGYYADDVNAFALSNI